MDYVYFKIRVIEKFQFESTLHDIMNEQKDICNSRQFDPTDNRDIIIAEIPKHCIDKMTEEQLNRLNSYVIVESEARHEKPSK